MPWERAVGGCRYGRRSERKGIRGGERVDEERVRLQSLLRRLKVGTQRKRERHKDNWIMIRGIIQVLLYMVF